MIRPLHLLQHSLFSIRKRAPLALAAIGLLLLLAAAPDAWAQEGKPVDKDRLRQKTETEVRDPTQPTVSFLDATNSTLMIRRDGLFPTEDPVTGTNGSFPKGKNASVVFAQGLLWGGQVADGTGRKTVRVNGSTYQSGMAPGGLRPDGTPEDASNEARFHVWRVDRGWATEEVIRRSAAYRAGVDTGAVSQSMVEATREQYRYDWNNWPVSDGAPYQECNGQLGYQPADAEAVASGTSCADLSGDIPGRPGANQTIWLVTNDVGSESEEDASKNSYGSPAIGMEVQFTLWSYDRPAADPLGNANFIRSRLIYKGLPNASSEARIDSMFVSWWADPDVGSAGNDFAGVDTSRALGFAYNAGATDEQYAAIDREPPAVGWDVLKGPETQSGDTIGLNSFVYSPNINFGDGPSGFGDYEISLQWYNWMRGVQPIPRYPNTDPYINPQTSEETRFLVSGDPVDETGWIDGDVYPPSDREIASTSGPFSIEKGDTVDVVVGKMAAIGEDRLDSITKLRSVDEVVEHAFGAPISNPTSLSTQVTDTSTVELSWAGVGDADLDHYEIFRSTDPIPGRLTELSPIATVQSAPSYVDEPESGQTYHYRVRAVTESGEESSFSNEASAFLYPQGINVSTSRTFGDITDSTDYRLVALPGRTDTSLADAVSGEAGVQWQAYWDDGNGFVRYENSDTFRFRAGNGFWLIATSEWTFDGTVPTVDLRADSATAIALHEDWNVISNPFGTDVNWAAVEAATGGNLQPIWSFGGAFDSTDTFASAASGEAYYFFNDDSERDSLVIPYPGAPGTAAPNAAPETKQGEATMLALTATPSRADGAASSTVQVGLSDNAEAGLGPEDLIAPPGRFAETSLRIEAPGETESTRTRFLMAERRPRGDEGGQTFRLRLTSRADGPVRLTAEHLDAVEGQSVALLHPSAGETYDLRQEETVEVEPEGETATLKLTVGTEAYVNSETDKVLPEEVTLTSYPNPARQQGTVEYALPDAKKVTLRLYDVLGREVTTLAAGRKDAGRHRVQLDADRLASGVYFGRLQAGDQTLTQKITIVR